MALVSDGYELNVVLIDNGANTTTKSYALTAADAAEAATQTAQVLAVLANVTDAVVKGYSINERFVESQLNLPPAAVQIENQAVVVGQIAGNASKFASMYIPAPKAGLFVSASGKSANIVDITDPAVVAYAAIYTATGDVCTISDGENLSVLVSGKRIHRGSRKG